MAGSVKGPAPVHVTPAKPLAAPKTKSGTHEAVVAYRAKLGSITDHEGAALADLDKELEAYLHSMVPPPPEATDKDPKP